MHAQVRGGATATCVRVIRCTWPTAMLNELSQLHGYNHDHLLCMISIREMSSLAVVTPCNLSPHAALGTDSCDVERREQYITS